MKQTILAIDNDPLVLMSIKMLFADADVEVETASSGELGIALFREHPDRFPVVLLDFEMKNKEGVGMDGDEVAVHLKTRIGRIKPELAVLTSSFAGVLGKIV